MPQHHGQGSVVLVESFNPGAIKSRGDRLINRYESRRLNSGNCKPLACLRRVLGGVPPRQMGAGRTTEYPYGYTRSRCYLEQSGQLQAKDLRLACGTFGAGSDAGNRFGGRLNDCSA